MKNPDNRFRSGWFRAGLLLGPVISGKSELIWKKIGRSKVWGTILVCEGSGGRKIEKMESLKIY